MENYSKRVKWDGYASLIGTLNWIVKVGKWAAEHFNIETNSSHEKGQRLIAFSQKSCSRSGLPFFVNPVFSCLCYLREERWLYFWFAFFWLGKLPIYKTCFVYYFGRGPLRPVYCKRKVLFQSWLFSTYIFLAAVQV